MRNTMRGSSILDHMPMMTWIIAGACITILGFIFVPKIIISLAIFELLYMMYFDYKNR